MSRCSRLFQVLLVVFVLFFLSFPLCSAQQFPTSLYQGMQWRMIGPFRGGRTRAISGVPSQPNVFYVGQVNGGVWKSDDYGRTWHPIFDAESTQSIGAIAVAPSDPNIVYVASGEGLHRPDLSVGNGIYKSTDAGKTWTHLGLRDSQQIPAMVVDPHNPNRLFAAVLGHPYGPNPERGIFRSLDGGQTWKKVLYKDENTGGSDVALDPANPEIVYAALWEAREGPWEDNNLYNGTGGGLFKSTDGGDTWHPLTNGLPKNLVQINVAIAASQPNRIYATIATTEKGDYASGAGLGFYRSDDAGEHWQQITTDPRPAMRIGGGDLPIPRVDPKNPDVVYSASIVTLRSTDGGKTWASLRGAPGGDDYQNLWINPENPQIILLVSDQGAIVTVNGGKTWSSWYNQPTAQLYHVATSNTFPYRVCGGQQESGSVCTLSRGNDGEITFRDWHPVGVIEYGYVAPDPLNPNLIYGAGRNEVSKYHWDTGQTENVTPIPLHSKKYRYDRTEPIVFSPVDPHTLYCAANVLFKTTDGGHSWQTISPDLTRETPGVPPSVGSLVPEGAAKQRGAIYALAPSFKNIGTIWAGTDDGLLWLTRDGGAHWTNITPGLTPWSKVTQIEASHFDDDTAYAAVSRFRVNDLHPYIYRTHDGGKTWKSIVNGLPDDAPVNAVREDPIRKGLLFAATEKAVWVSFDDGEHWQSLQQNLPHTSMRDLAIHDNDLIVATHGRSFWILDDITPLRQLSVSVESAPAFLFQPEAAYRVRRDTNTDTPLPADEPAGQNPPDGAVIDYYLNSVTTGPVTLEVLDGAGRLVRKYSSTDKPEPTLEELEKQLIPLYWIRMPRTLSAQSGMHRWVWDLHAAAPIATHHTYPISAVPHDTPQMPQGPHVLPGVYTVRLTADGKVYTAPLIVKIDPRVHISPAALATQFQTETQLAFSLTETSNALLEARSMQQQIAALPANSATAATVATFKKQLHAILDGDEEGASEASQKPASTVPGLESTNSNLETLYTNLGMADAPPPTATLQATSQTLQAASAAMQRWNEWKQDDFPKLNQALHRAGQQELNPETKAPIEEGEGDVD
ncbi:MAG TPA: glycoside hydrolase [Acidobacteriaceae bacterium]|jgi:photosystem II stability/assembly factor-like uncharacterized protein|nr:glycoside hydrolase [Acidobacteriaceae bacterium]